MCKEQAGRGEEGGGKRHLEEFGDRRGYGGMWRIEARKDGDGRRAERRGGRRRCGDNWSNLGMKGGNGGKWRI